MTLFLDGYIRVSRVNGRSGDSFISPEQQRDQIEAFARVMGATIAEWHTDLDQSGGKTDRPGLNAALARIEAGATGGLIVAKIDRFARAVEAYSVVRRILDRDAIFASAAERLDPTTPMGKAMLQIVLVFGELELDRFRDNWTDSQARAVARGVWIGPAPLGFGKDERGRLVHDERAPVMAEAFRVAASDGVGAADALLAEAIPGRRRHVSDTRRLLANRDYLGEHHAPDGLAHEPITTAALFEAAQSESRGRRASGDYPLSHIATCEACGAGLVGALQTVRGRKYRRMRCSATCAGGVGSVSADALEAHVREVLRPALAGHFERDVIGSAVDDAQAALDLAESRLTRYLQDTETRDEVGEDQWRAGRRAHTAKVAEARKALAKVATQTARSQRLPGPEQLDDPGHFAAALAGLVAAVSVRPGRGALVERVPFGAFRWVRDEADDTAGLLAA